MSLDTAQQHISRIEVEHPVIDAAESAAERGDAVVSELHLLCATGLSEADRERKRRARQAIRCARWRDRHE